MILPRDWARGKNILDPYVLGFKDLNCAIATEEQPNNATFNGFYCKQVKTYFSEI